MAGDRVGNRVQMRLHRGNGSGLEQVAACRKEDFPEKQDVSEKKNQKERNRGQKISKTPDAIAFTPNWVASGRVSQCKVGVCMI